MTGTSYSKIYRRAITEFKDPTLKKLLEDQTIMFYQVMYNFLENAIGMFTSPIQTRKKLTNRQMPHLFSNQILGDGESTKFTLSEYPSSSMVEDCIFEYKIDGHSVNGEYFPEDSTVVFPYAIPENTEASVEIYYVGNWNGTLNDREEYILSEFVMACWSEYIQNDKLDIVRLLGDTDFKLTAVSSTTSAKSNWNIVNRETATKKMNKYAWDCQMRGVYL